MADIDVDTEKETALPVEVKPRPLRGQSGRDRAADRSPAVEEKNNPSLTGRERDADIVFEPVERQPYIISYVCVLIPRFDTHFLQGDVVNFLHEWMEQLAISFTWKLE